MQLSARPSTFHPSGYNRGHHCERILEDTFRLFHPKSTSPSSLRVHLDLLMRSSPTVNLPLVTRMLGLRRVADLGWFSLAEVECQIPSELTYPARNPQTPS